MTFNLASSKGGPSGYRMSAKGDSGEIYLYGVIGGDWFGGGVTADQFAKDLRGLGAVKNIDIRINSEGGSVFEGKAIYSLLVANPASVTVHIDGLAASAASFIAMAGNRIEIAEGAFMMIHDAWSIAMGRAEDLRREADLLDVVNGTLCDVYVARTKQPQDKVRKWMSEETWFTGQEAVDNGFADKVVANLKVAASVAHPERYKRLPTALNPRRAAATASIDRVRELIRR